MGGFKFKCKHCGKPGISRTSTRGRFCNRQCFGLSRRKHRTLKEKRALKAEYDRKLRGSPDYRTYRLEAYQRNLASYRRYQIKRRRDPQYKRYMKKYLKTYWTPELKEQKSEYDRKFRAKKLFGPLWEIYYLTNLLNKEVKSRMSNYEIRYQNGTLNKAMNRGRNGEVKRGYT